MEINNNLETSLFWFSPDERCLEVWRDKSAPSWGGQFRRVFNGEFKSFKTLAALKKDAERLIAKFDMFQTDSEFNAI